MISCCNRSMAACKSSMTAVRSAWVAYCVGSKNDLHDAARERPNVPERFVEQLFQFAAGLPTGDCGCRFVMRQSPRVCLVATWPF